MNLKNEFQPIRDWAYDRKLYQNSTLEKHYIKLGEEFGELGAAILKNDKFKIIDSIGDMIIVLVNLSEIFGIEVLKKDAILIGGIEDFINQAYKEISNRKGKMINGTFVKD